MLACIFESPEDYRIPGIRLRHRHRIRRNVPQSLSDFAHRILNRATWRVTGPSGKSFPRMKKRNDEGKTPRGYARFSACAPNIILESYPLGWPCGVTTIKCRPVHHASLSQHYEFIHSRVRANASVHVHIVRSPGNATD